MSRKIYAAIFALLFAGLTVAASLNYRGRVLAARPPASSAMELMGMLPASDAVAFFDAQRTLSEVVPHIFANDAKQLAHINQEIDKFRDETGTDVRQFDTIAASLRFAKTGSSTEYVMGFARGRISASEVIANAMAKDKTRRSTKWKEEQYEGTTIYTVEKSGGFCLAVFDSNTIAFGDLAGIRAALDVRAGRASHADSSLVELATLNGTAISGFAANIPRSVAQSLAGQEELTKSFAYVNQMYGSVDATATAGTVSLTLRSGTGEQAQELAKTLNTLRQIASIYTSSRSGEQPGASADDKNKAQAAARSLGFPPKWVKDVTIEAEGNDVKIRLEEPLTDLAPLFPF